jgi:hypothetical protein
MAATATTGVILAPRMAAELTCACGQALECTHTAHCPRCGVTLHG